MKTKLKLYPSTTTQRDLLLTFSMRFVYFYMLFVYSFYPAFTLIISEAFSHVSSKAGGTRIYSFNHFPPVEHSYFQILKRFLLIGLLPPSPAHHETS